MERQDARLMTEGSLPKQIIRFSIPLMISNVLQVLFNMSDIAVVGQFAGAEALGAVGSTTTLVTLFTGFLIGMGSGVNVTLARYIGAGENREASDTVHTSALLCLGVGAVLLLAGLTLATPLLELLGTRPELEEGAALYLRVYFLGMPAMALYNFGNAVSSAAGDTRHPLIVLAAAGVLNVALNLFFVIVCGMGVLGVALASVISQYVSAGLMMALLFRSQWAFALDPHKLRLNGDRARQVLALGIPAGMQNAIFAVANLFIQGGVNTFDAVVVEGNAAAANADALVYDVMAALYMACSSFMSQNMGAGNRKRVMRSYRLCLGYSFAIGVVLGLALVFFGRGFLALFTGETAVIEAGMSRLTVMGLSYGFSAFMDCTIAASRGLGRSVMPTVIVILGSCVFRVVWVYTVFAHFHTIMSLYLLYIFSWGITAVAEIAYFVYAWRHTTWGKDAARASAEG